MSDDQQKWQGFPEPLRDIFEGLWQEAASLHSNWDLYFDWFCDTEKIAVLNATVPSVFQLIEENLRASMTVSLGRLADPSKTGSKANLSLSRLVESLPDHCDDGLCRAAEQRLAEIKDLCGPIMKHRNRRVAHNDLATTINYHENPLPGIGQSRIVSALDEIAGLMNLLQLHFEDGETAYSHRIRRGKGKDLIFLLEQAMEYDRLKRDAELAKYGITK